MSTTIEHARELAQQVRARSTTEHRYALAHVDPDDGTVRVCVCPTASRTVEVACALDPRIDGEYLAGQIAHWEGLAVREQGRCDEVTIVLTIDELALQACRIDTLNAPGGEA